MYYSIMNSGLPHSEILGSKFTYNSPRHIGVSPVLRQLLVPRHPPCALVHLTKPTINILRYTYLYKKIDVVDYLALI